LENEKFTPDPKSGVVPPPHGELAISLVADAVHDKYFIVHIVYKKCHCVARDAVGEPSRKRWW